MIRSHRFHPADSGHTCTRRGVGLLEVIICTALVAVMIVPIAGVIRSSAKSIGRSNGSATTEAQLRRGLRWLAMTVRDSQIQSIRPRVLRLRLDNGEDAVVRIRRGQLLLQSDDENTVIADPAKRIDFAELKQSAAPQERIGLSMLLTADDPNTGTSVSVDTVVAIRPQI